MSKALIEAIREAVRLIVLAVIPVILVVFTDFSPTSAGIATIILRFIEKYQHKAGKLSLPF